MRVCAVCAQQILLIIHYTQIRLKRMQSIFIVDRQGANLAAAVVPLKIGLARSVDQDRAVSKLLQKLFYLNQI